MEIQFIGRKEGAIGKAYPITLTIPDGTLDVMLAIHLSGYEYMSGVIRKVEGRTTVTHA